MNKEIVIITGSMARGGAEGVIAQVSSGLAERGWTIHIIGLLFNEVGYKLHSRVDFRCLADSQRSTAFDSVKLVLRLRKAINEINPDVVVSFMAKMNIITHYALMGTGRRFIASERNDPSVGRSYIYRMLVENAYAATETMVFQTSRAKNYFPERIQAKGVIIPNPVQVMPEACPNPQKKIVSVGRLTKQKNHKLLIDAFGEIEKDFPQYELDIYGAGEIEGEIRSYIQDKALEDKVHLKGKVDNIPDHIKDAYMFVHTANYEGLSNALLEAMAIGLPCISTNCAGADDAIQNGINGLLVPVGDRAAIITAMRKILEDSHYAQELGNNARKIADRYSAETVIDQWEEIIMGK